VSARQLKAYAVSGDAAARRLSARTTKISRQLIQRLVTSNPSPAYVGRIAAVFENNGGNVRGDMMAIVRAILLDEEARDGMGLSLARSESCASL
jgi:uncharacterized protein (DUF1800 family)